MIQIRFISEGSRVELRGLYGNGGRRVESVPVLSGGWTTVRWDG